MERARMLPAWVPFVAPFLFLCFRRGADIILAAKAIISGDTMLAFDGHTACTNQPAHGFFLRGAGCTREACLSSLPRKYLDIFQHEKMNYCSPTTSLTSVTDGFLFCMYNTLTQPMRRKTERNTSVPIAESAKAMGSNPSRGS